MCRFPAAIAGRGYVVGVLGVPDQIRGFLFDLDGVLTKTAVVHRAAWKQMFDSYLSERAGTGFEPFTDDDYDDYVDGKPRADGVRSFLASRGIGLPEGTDDDPPGAETVHGLGNRKNDLVLAKLREDGVEVYQGSVRYVQAVKAAGLPCAVVSSSANTHQVLDSTGLAPLFDAVIDGNTIEQQHLAGKPAPDSFLAGASALGLQPRAASVFEDALAGVAAGRAGRFGFVVGVDRVGHASDLKSHGADIVVGDLEQLLDGS